MDEFIAKYQEQISGVLTGFDRLVFRGHLRALSYPGGMNQYLASTLAKARAQQRPIE